MSAQLPDDEPDVEGTPETVPTKTPDTELELTDAGIEMPEFLRGYVGDFTLRTPNVTGEFETTDSGLPDQDRADTIFAVVPESGDHHSDLQAGMMALSTEENSETVFEIIDNRSEK